MKKLKVDETTNKIAGNHELLEETCSSTIVSQMPQMPKLLNNKELFNSVFISAPSRKRCLIRYLLHHFFGILRYGNVIAVSEFK